MYKRILIVVGLLVALVMSLALTGTVAAQSDSDPKAVTGVTAAGMMRKGDPGPNCTNYYHEIELNWNAPTKPPDGYRIRWGPAGSFRSWKKANTIKKGNMFVDGSTTTATLSGIRLKCSRPLTIEVRARYKGESNGPWS